MVTLMQSIPVSQMSHILRYQFIIVDVLKFWLYIFTLIESYISILFEERDF